MLKKTYKTTEYCYDDDSEAIAVDVIMSPDESNLSCTIVLKFPEGRYFSSVDVLLSIHWLRMCK